MGSKGRKAVLTFTLITVNVCLSREKHPSLKHPPPPSICCLFSPARRPSMGSAASRDGLQLPPTRRGEVARSPCPAFTGNCLLRTTILYLHCTDLHLSGLHRIARHASNLRTEDGTFCCCLRSSLIMTCAAVCGLNLCFHFSLVFHGTSTHGNVVSILWLMDFPFPIFSNHKQCRINAPFLSTLWVGLFLVGGRPGAELLRDGGVGACPRRTWRLALHAVGPLRLRGSRQVSSLSHLTGIWRHQTHNFLDQSGGYEM